MHNRIIMGSLLLIISISAILFIYSQKYNPTIAYVDSGKLFTDFNMTKELRKSGEKEIKNQERKLDSLQIVLTNTADQASKSLLIQQIIKQRQEIDEFHLSFSQQNSEKIWSRISLYTKEFAESNKFEMIIGADGNQQVLYCSKEKDVTLLLLSFINKKYEGFQ